MKGRFVSNETGGATLYAVLGILALIGYTVYGDALMGEEIDPILKALILAGIAIFAVVTTGCSIHLKKLGSKPNRAIRRDLESNNEWLHRLSLQTRGRIAQLEALMIDRPEAISRRSTDCLSMAKKIIGAVEKRLADVAELLEGGSHVDLMEASQIAYRKLIVSDSFLDSVIFSESVPDLELEELQPTLDKLFKTIEADLRMLPNVERLKLAS